MSTAIVGKVAALEDNYRVVINRGAEHGVKGGMIFVIEDPEGKEVRDPDSNEFLTYLPIEKIKVKVFEVKEKFCRAETFIRVKPESAYEAAARELIKEYKQRSIFDIGRMAYPGSNIDRDAKLQQALHLLQLGAADRSDDERPAVVEVNVGDTARQAN
ncbi:hypothetical protein [Mycolicibacterium sp. P9-22]|uniref:hypothetical protein n=1 Tax=Mycolicibacterium sp. P9-22 TaxID=2024613 RepID=UPI0011EF2E20|nr:hypothetical protein [Mycolicibacterium sp. P9-22]